MPLRACHGERSRLQLLFKLAGTDTEGFPFWLFNLVVPVCLRVFLVFCRVIKGVLAPETRSPCFSRFFLLLVTLLLACFTGCSYGYFLSTLSTDFEVSMSLSIVLLVSLFLFSGMMTSAATIPVRSGFS